MRTTITILFLAALCSGCCSMRTPIYPVEEIARAEIDVSKAVRNRLVLDCDTPITTVADTLILRYPADAHPRYLALRIYGIPPSTKPKPLRMSLMVSQSITDRGAQVGRYVYRNIVSSPYDKYGHSLILLRLPEGIDAPYLRLRFLGDANVNCVTFGDTDVISVGTDYPQLEDGEGGRLNSSGTFLGDCISYGYFKEMPTKPSTATK